VAERRTHRAEQLLVRSSSISCDGVPHGGSDGGLQRMQSGRGMR
jgi:hypothetical protein